MESNPGEAWPWIKDGVELISNYADAYHHAKEEDILFAYAAADSEIIQAMHQEHELGRNYRRQITVALETKDTETAATNLLAYRDLLLEHIKKEDEILYPWIDRGLSDAQVGEVFNRFVQANAQAEPGCPEKYLEFVEHLEQLLA